MDYAELLVPFAEAANIRARDVAGALRVRLVVSLAFVDAPRLHAALGGAADVDWARARAFVSESAFGPAEWTRLLAHKRFAEPFVGGGGLAHLLDVVGIQPGPALQVCVRICVCGCVSGCGCGCVSRVCVFVRVGCARVRRSGR